MKLKDLLKEEHPHDLPPNDKSLKEFAPGPFGITMAVGILLKALYKWAKSANRKDKNKLKDFAKKL